MLLKKQKPVGFTQKSVSQENAFQKKQKPVGFFFRKTIGSSNSLL